MARKQPAVEVRPANFGQGVYALRRLRRGMVIGQILGKVITDENYTSRYCMELGNGEQLEPHAPFRFVNHSCQPNCELMYYDPETLRPDQDHLRDQLFIQVTRTIQAGEELSIDYAWPADHAIPCGCSAKNCRGWIVDADELHLIEQGLVEFIALPA